VRLRKAEEELIAQIKIVVADLSQLAADLLDRAITSQPDMVIVGRLRSLAGLEELARAVAPEVVIVGVSERRIPAECLALLADTDRLIVVALEAKLGVAHMYELSLDRDDLGAISPAELIDSVRSRARSGGLRSSWPVIPPSQP
jgi:chemotaxis response regulator CheB